MLRLLRPSRRYTPTVDIGREEARRGLVIAKLYYFCFFGAIGCLVPFLNVYLEYQGLSGAQIGLINSIAPLIALAANPFWGALSDRWQIHRIVLAFCAALAGGVSLFLIGAADFWAFLLLIGLLTFFRSPVPALLDSTTMGLVKRVDESYGRQRMWGSVAFVMATYGLGQVLTLSQMLPAFWLHALVMGIGCGGLSLLLPIRRSPQRINVAAGLRRLSRSASYMTFLGAIVLLGMGTSSFFNFVGLHILALGGTEAQLGMAFAVTGLAEIPIMFMGARWFGRYRHGRLILVGFGGFVGVWILFSLATSALQVVLLMALNGICFGMIWVAVVGFASDTAPTGLEATAQSLVAAAQGGLGMSLGALVAGTLWDVGGGPVIFRVAAACLFLAGVIFFAGNRRELG